MLKLTLPEELLKSDDWPVAIEEEFISPGPSIERGRTILQLLVGQEQLQRTKKLLDFGCGDGETIWAANELGIEAVGYDPQTNTTTLEEVTARGPYDTIIAFDVLDHLVDDTLESVLVKMREVLAFEGRLCIRCHPYQSRSGTHLFRQLNKAYVHLFFPHKLKEWGLKQMHTSYFSKPTESYSDAIKAAGLTLVYSLETKRDIEPFFLEHMIQHSISCKCQNMELEAVQLMATHTPLKGWPLQ